MRAAVVALSATVFLPALLTAQAPRGTIAVIPFGASTPVMVETAEAFAIAVEAALQESGRFTAVLPRASDVNIKKELRRSTEPVTLESVVKLSQDAQLNANFVLSGWIIGQDIVPGKDAKGNTTGNTAQARVAVRIADVSTGAMVVSDIVTISSGPSQDMCGGGLGGAACQAQNLAKRSWAYPSQAEALKSLRTNGNAKQEILKSLTEKLGYMVIDLIEEKGKPVLVLRAAGGDPKKGTKLQAVQTRTSALNGTTYMSPVGKLEVTSVVGETAMASIGEGADKIIEALKKNQAILIIKS